jgi:hypothetical protein
MGGFMNGLLRGYERAMRLQKVWKAQSPAVKEQAQRERVAELRSELRRMKDELPPEHRRHS